MLVLHDLLNHLIAVPRNLIAAYFRLQTVKAGVFVAIVAVFVTLLVWLIRTLGDASIQSARAAVGRPSPRLFIPAALGVGFSALIVFSVTRLVHGDAAAQAVTLAEQQFGPDYRYSVERMQIAMRGDARSYYAVVTAWNDAEIRHVPIFWDERP